MIAFNFPPSTTAGVHRSLRFAKYLPEYQCTPTVVTRNADVEPGGEELLKQVPECVSIWRVGQSAEAPAKTESDSSSQSVTLKKRIKRWLKPLWELVTETPDQHIAWSRMVGRYAIERCREQQFDVLYTTGPPHSMHLAGYRIHKQTGLPWVADFRDPWARRPWVKSRNPIGQKFLKRFESLVAHHATVVLLNNEASEEDFQKAYPNLPKSKFRALPNGFDPDLLPLVNQLRDGQRSRPDASKSLPVLCHPGTLYGQRDPSAIIKAIAKLHREGTDVRFQQIGFVAKDFPPDRIAAEMGIAHLVEVVPPVSHRRVFEYMVDADVLMVIQPHGPLMVPGKVYEMLMFDQPIVGVCDGKATNSVLDSAGRAWTSPSDDVDGIANAIRRAIGSADEELPKRRQARDAFNGRLLCKKLADVLRECASLQ